MKTFRSLAMFSLLTLSAYGQHAATLSHADSAAIEATIDTSDDALTAMDFAKFGTTLTDDIDFVNVVGMHWVGKAQVVKAHSVIFTTRYHGFPLHVVDRSESMLAPNLALVVATLKMDDYTAQDGKRMINNLSRMTYVLEKQNGTWLIRSAHNTTIDPVAAQHDPVQAKR